MGKYCSLPGWFACNEDTLLWKLPMADGTLRSCLDEKPWLISTGCDRRLVFGHIGVLWESPGFLESELARARLGFRFLSRRLVLDRPVS